MTPEGERGNDETTSGCHETAGRLPGHPVTPKHQLLSHGQQVNPHNLLPQLFPSGAERLLLHLMTSLKFQHLIKVPPADANRTEVTSRDVTQSSFAFSRMHFSAFFIVNSLTLHCLEFSDESPCLLFFCLFSHVPPASRYLFSTKPLCVLHFCQCFALVSHKIVFSKKKTKN